MKRLVFDLTKIPFLKRLIGISRLIVELLDDQNLFTDRIWLNRFRVMSRFVEVVISQNELKLLGNGKMNHLKYFHGNDLKQGTCPYSETNHLRFLEKS